jgi:hypothetical protein
MCYSVVPFCCYVFKIVKPTAKLIDVVFVEAARQAKSKQKGDSHADGEGDGWETASEGSEEVDDASYNGDPTSSDGKVATTSENNEEHFEDALTEEELRAVSGI